MRLEVNNFDLETTILSGSCFRVIKEEDCSFTNILKDRVINIKQINNVLIVDSNKLENLKDLIIDYFDLDRDYDTINSKLINNDSIMKDIVDKTKGYHILNQDSFEMCISYIISQNNNVKRISNSVENLSRKYGTKIFFNNKEYYLFPNYEQLKNITIEELKSLGLGFRDKYIRNFLDEYPHLKDISKLSTIDALTELMKVKGIGLKVASCILLFGYKRLDVFPIDTWVKQNFREIYKVDTDNINIIQDMAKTKYEEYSGLALQYLFHSKRNINK